MSLFSRIANVFRTRAVDRDLDEEQQFHFEARIDALVASGLTRDAARAEATRRFGGRLQTREASRDARLVPWLESLARDTRFALRRMRRDAGVSGAAIVSLALAIGACTAAFALVDALMLRPLPVREPQRLVYATYPTYFPANPTGESFSWPVFERLRAASAGRAELLCVSYPQARRGRLPGGDDPREEFRVQFVSGNAFDQLGVRPALGRLLGPVDTAGAGATPVAVLDYRFWVRRFGADPSIVGRGIDIEGKRLEIVGVASADFFGVEPGRRPHVWLPVSQYDPRAFTSPQWQWLRIIARLSPGVEPAALQAMWQPAFTGLRREMAARFPPERPRESVERFVNTPLSVESAVSGPSSLRRELGRPLLVLSVVAGLVLLIAASNVTNLLLARGAARAREMSMRLSLGASRLRLLQQSLVESALLAVTASVLAIAFAQLAAPAIVTMLAPANEPAFLDLRLDWRVTGFLVLLAAAVTMLVGAGPALRASRTAPMGAVGVGAGRATERKVLLRSLVAAQMGFSVCVLFIAGLLLTSFVLLSRVDLGFNADRLMLVSVDAPELTVPTARREAAAQLVDRVRALPGVEAASLSAWPMFTQGGWTNQVMIPGKPPDGFEVIHLQVSPGFFETMKMPMLQGRDLIRQDTTAAPTDVSSIVVNEAFVQRYFDGAAAVGRIVERRSQEGVARQMIVGVVRNAIYSDPREPAPPCVYLPLRGFGSLQVRTSGPPLALADAVRRAARETNPAIVINNVTLQTTLIDNALLRERLLALLSAFFAIAGVILTAVGVYGVLSYSVIRRTREIGVRMALGARRASIVGSVLREVSLVTLIGIVEGLACGLWLARWVTSLLFGIAPFSAASLALPVAAIVSAAALAALAPSLRASRVDPIVALREE